MQLIASNGQCSDTIVMNVVVEEDFTFYAPNAFSPNGDGINEIFLPVGIMWEPSRFDMWIFDRWGNMIFHTSDLNKGWDGRVNGDPKIVQEDVYVWKVNVYDTHGKKHQFVGHISLIK
ncbi:MAG TPA: gliding motility-associated C-terminal domain-containing protein [Bacteroidia bacterium]